MALQILSQYDFPFVNYSTFFISALRGLDHELANNNTVSQKIVHHTHGNNFVNS